LDESDYFHSTAAFMADERVNLVDAFNHSCPGGGSFWWCFLLLAELLGKRVVVNALPFLFQLILPSFRSAGA